MKKWIHVIIMVFILLSVSKVNAQESSYEVHFMDIGQSDCILIKGIDKNYLIDTGLPRTYAKVLDYLNSQGVNKIDQIIITHYHDDHYGGLERLINDKAVSRVILPRHQPKYRDFIFSYLGNKDIKVEYVTEDFTIKDDHVDLKVLLPEKEDMVIENNNGTVLIGSIDGIKYAFMADVEKEREQVLLKNKDILSSDIIKIPHHALDTSSTDNMIKAVGAKVAVITCDGGESPNDEIAARYLATKAALFRTDINGNIVIKANTKNKSIEINANKVIE